MKNYSTAIKSVNSILEGREKKNKSTTGTSGLLARSKYVGPTRAMNVEEDIADYIDAIRKQTKDFTDGNK
tara:strand:+ start:185 stop:394 length:210 start_codon:yes stop_codon:yes gene_type:complete